MAQVTAVVRGEIARVDGPGFEFRKVGGIAKFEQTGKTPSLRAAKAICKAVTKLSDSLGG